MIFCSNIRLFGKSTFCSSGFGSFTCFLMLSFGFFKSFYINCKSIFCTKFLSKFQRISVSFIKIICNFTRNDFFRIFHEIWKKFLEFSFTFFKCCAEFCFFGSKFTENFFFIFFQFRICIFKVFDYSCSNFCHKIFFDAKFHSMTNSTTNQTAQNISSSYTVWSYAFLVTKNEYG